MIVAVPIWAAQKSGANLIPQKAEYDHVKSVAGETISDENCLAEN
jgi:hypothetical protein